MAKTAQMQPFWREPLFYSETGLAWLEERFLLAQWGPSM